MDVVWTSYEHSIVVVWTWYGPRMDLVWTLWYNALAANIITDYVYSIRLCHTYNPVYTFNKRLQLILTADDNSCSVVCSYLE